MGAKVIATVVSKNSQWVKLKVSEVNGVSVVISSADLRVHQTNRFAKTIALFLWKVPVLIEYSRSISIDPLDLSRNPEVLKLPIDSSRPRIVEYLIGAKFEYVLVLRGSDEIGRPITVKINF